MMVGCVVVCLLLRSSWALTPSRKDHRPLVRRAAFFKKNPFDRRPGATVGKLQVALANGNWQVSKFVGEEARAMNGNSAAGLADFVSAVCTGLCRKQADWLYAAEMHDVFGGGAVERNEHERYYNRLVNAEAAKFDKEYLPTAAELASAADQPGGLCVVSIVCALEGDVTDIFEGAPMSTPALRNALTDLAGAVQIDDGYNLYNAEVLWTPSSAEETLLKEDTILDFPELLAL